MHKYPSRPTKFIKYFANHYPLPHFLDLDFDGVRKLHIYAHKTFLITWQQHPIGM